MTCWLWVFEVLLLSERFLFSRDGGGQATEATQPLAAAAAVWLCSTAYQSANQRNKRGFYYLECIGKNNCVALL